MNIFGNTPVMDIPANCLDVVHNNVHNIPVALMAPVNPNQSPNLSPPTASATSTNVPSVHSSVVGTYANPTSVGIEYVAKTINTAKINALGYVYPGFGISSAHVPAQSNPLVFQNITAKNFDHSIGFLLFDKIVPPAMA